MPWHHWLIDDFYSPIWPNIAASALLAVLVIAKLRALERLHKLHHKQAMAKADAQHAQAERHHIALMKAVRDDK